MNHLELNSNYNNKELKEKLRYLIEDCYYEKELYFSTKQKLEKQNKKINLLYKENDDLKEKKKKIEEENQKSKNQIENELKKIEYNISIEKKSYLYKIGEQNKEIELLEYEIETLKKKKEFLNNKLYKKSMSTKNIFENPETIDNIIIHSKTLNKRGNSIESKIKRKPFNNFNFIE